MFKHLYPEATTSVLKSKWDIDTQRIIKKG